MKILMSEDDPEIAGFVQKGLQSELYTVEIATDGERGSFLARTERYALIILDCLLPKQSGAEVLKEIRDDCVSTPVLMLTVKAEMQCKKEAFSLGADDYLTKPFLFDELLLRVKALIRRPLKIAPKISRLDDLTINHESKIVRCSGKEVYLTRREFALLEYLLENKDAIVSRSQILDHVWDYDSDPFSNSLETHIASLRKKLNKNKSRDLIHTFTGRGYKMSLRKIG